MSDTQQCSGRCPGKWTDYPCANRVTLTEEGKPWCHAHAPSRVAAKQSLRDAKEALAAQGRAAKMLRLNRKDEVVAAAMLWRIDPTDDRRVALADAVDAYNATQEAAHE